MSEENVEIVRRMFERFARGDFSGLADLADEFEWVSSPELPDAGTYRGEAAKRWIAAWVESFKGFTAEATEIIDAGDKVFVAIFQRGGVAGSQTVVEGQWWIVVTVRDGVVVRSEAFVERAQALEAAGLRSRRLGDLDKGLPSEPREEGMKLRGASTVVLLVVAAIIVKRVLSGRSERSYRSPKRVRRAIRRIA
jgi:ketosteroid isomerase-like protein